MTITKEQIARLRELEKAATKGPWGYEDGELYAGDESLPVIRYDLDLIVKSRNLLPALLDEVERLQESQEIMRKYCYDRVDAEGARVFDAVIEAIKKNLPDSEVQWTLNAFIHERERILRGGDHGQD